MNVKLMGILNVTPDSFSDGGEFFEPGRAVDRALEMAAEGATVIDIGAESTRPGSAPITAEEQLRRLLPVVKKLGAKRAFMLSIDTQSAAVAEACLGEGVEMLNDVSALRGDPRMTGVLAKSRCEIILMHMQGTPATMQIAPRYNDVVQDISDFFRERITACEAAGIARERLWLDPGFGFGKTLAHNIELVRHFDAFVELGRPVLGAVSRKSFLTRLDGADAANDLLTRHSSLVIRHSRDRASIEVGMELVGKGASMLRVHDVAGHAAALKVFEVLNVNELE